MPFPPNWPTYLPKDKLAGWFEAYVEAMELNFWTGTELVSGAYDDARQRWSVELRRADGSIRTLHPRHVVMATGVSCVPHRPELPGLERFAGQVVHSSEYRDGEAWQGKHALVIGTGNSGHDIAHDLHAGGAHVTLVQRSPTLILSIEPSGQLAYAFYDEGPPLEDCDLIASAVPFSLVWRAHALLAEHAIRCDRALLDGLARVGFALDYGKEGRGWQYKYLTRGGGYYFNVGCSELVVAGDIGLVQYTDIVAFETDGARLRDGTLLRADLVVLATGYHGQEALVRRLFGERIADRVGPVWGFGEEAELRNVYKRTAQPGLWFMMGSLAQSRINSKYLALQIKACEEGLLPLTLV
jgi:putative flavoprotein involved in K+ transport